MRAAEFYVAPSSVPTGNGSITSPWDLQTALNHPSAVKPGDTIWLPGGTHRLYNRTTKFISQLSGKSSAPSTARQYPGERATIDGNIQQIYGGWVNYWGFEIMNSHPNRYTAETGPFPQAWWVLYDGKYVDLCVSGFDLQAPNVKLINLIIRDSIGGGIGVNKSAQNAEIYGCLSYYNGWQGSDRGHGHGLYGQNAAPYVKTIKDNMFFENLALGLQATGGGPDPVADNFKIEGNAFFMNSNLSWNHQANVLIGAFQGRAQNPSFIKNFVYDTMGSSSDSNMGYTGGSDNAQIKDNFFHTSVMFSYDNYNMTLTGNTFAGGTVNLDKTKHPNNSYLSSKPTSNFISVRPNQYETGRANIVIYNYQKLNTVTVDVTGIGLIPGEQYELRNVQNYFGDIITGTYNGGSISVPMTGRTIAKPVGQNFSTPPTTFPDFGAFVIMKKSGGTTPPPPVNTPPTITSVANQTINEDNSTATLNFTVGDAETSAANLTVTATSSNTTLVPAANIVLGGSGSSRTVKVTPAANQFGTATVTLKVSDGVNTTSTSFVVTVNAVNDLPTISAISAQTTLEDTATGDIAFTVSDVETPAANLTVTASSSNQTLVPNASIALGGSGANRTVKVTPGQDQFGTVTITLTVNDGSATATTSFVLTVTSVNDVPTITSIANQTTAQDKAVGPISFTVGDVETPAGNLIVAGGSSDQTLVPNANLVFGGSGDNRTITITPASGKSGTATITVSVNDTQASKSTSFTLSVTGGTTPPPPSTNTTHIAFEAEAGSIVSPMAIVTDTQMPARRYVWSTVANSGTVTHSVDIPKAGTYYMWAKVLCPTWKNDSFFISVNGVEDTFDAAEGKASPNWQWAQVNGRGGKGPLTLNPRTFNLVQGKNTVVIRGREINAGMDRIIITSDPNYAPAEVTAAADSVTAYAGAATQILAADLLKNDAALFNDTLTVSSVTTPANGTATLSGNAINYTPKAGFTGTDSFNYTVSNGQGSTSTAKVTVTVLAPSKVYMGLEAEAATLASPMAVTTDTQVATRKFIATTAANTGTATYNVAIPKTDTYYLWAKVLCQSWVSDSFFVSINDKEDVFDAAEGKQSANWQWSLLNGRNGGAPLTLNPRDFDLTQGAHTIVVRGREIDAGMDRIIITNDRDYVPSDVTAVADNMTASPNTAKQISAASLLANDIALFGDPMTITAVSVPANGTATLSGTTITYTPKAGFTGADSFTYTVSDGQGSTSSAKVTVTVQ